MTNNTAAPQDERAIVLPKIPDPCGKIGLGPGVGYVWDQHQVEDYARAAVLADRAALPAQAVAPAHCLDVTAIRNAALDEAASLVETTRETTTIVGGGDTQRHLTARKTAGDLSGMTWAEGIRGLKADDEGKGFTYEAFDVELEKL